MDGDAEEHVAEVARVLSRYVDLIKACVRFRSSRIGTASIARTQ